MRLHGTQFSYLSDCIVSHNAHGLGFFQVSYQHPFPFLFHYHMAQSSHLTLPCCPISHLFLRVFKEDCSLVIFIPSPE